MNAPDMMADPTADNELRKLQSMVNEQPERGADQAGAAEDAAAGQRADRVAYFETKIRPFVDVFGSRLKIPLTAQEAADLTGALAGVGAEVLPDGIGEPRNPWMKLLVVSGMIAVPRAIAAFVEKQQRAKAGEGGEAPPAEKGKPEKRTGDTMLDALAGFDESNRKPH